MLWHVYWYYIITIVWKTNRVGHGTNIPKYYLKRGEFNIARTELPRSNSITNEIQLDLD